MHRLVILFALMLPLALTPATIAQTRTAKPALVVVVSVDQLAYDYLERFAPNFSPGGLANQCRTRGVWFANCKHQHAYTYTGPGHACLLTSTYPNRHGIIGNSWYDRKNRRSLYCVRDREVKLVGAETKDSPSSPALLLADTVGDQLKLASNGRSRVYTVAIKDRAAILMGGRLADAAIWMTNQGDWISCSDYTDSIPESLEQLNANRDLQKYAGRVWDRSRRADSYHHGAKEDSRYERPAYGMKRDFPHKLPTADDENFIRNLACSPFGNEVTLHAARTLIVSEQLGRGDHPDLLAINLSSNDYVGHSFGPQSLEVEDMTYRTDDQLGRFVDFLNEHVGDGRFVMFVSADHGVAPIPEIAAQRKIPSVRNPLGRTGANGNIVELEKQLESLLKERFPAEPSDHDKLGLVDVVVDNAIYLNPEHPALEGGRFRDACRVARDWILEQPYVVAAMTREQLLKKSDSGQQLENLMRRAFHPRRSGDVAFVLKPYCFQGGAATTHGSPWHYDRHVPLLVVGDVRASDEITAPVSPASIGTTIARLLRIPSPSMADAPALDQIRMRDAHKVSRRDP